MDGLAIVLALSMAAAAAGPQTFGAVSNFVRARAKPAIIEVVTAAKAEFGTYDRPNPLPGGTPMGQDARAMRSFDAWQLHPGHEVSPRGAVAAFLLAERGRPTMQCDLIDDLVEGDCSLRNLFEQREQSVAGKEWLLQGDGTDENSATAARVLAYAFKRIALIDTLLHLLGANRYGYSAAEMDWGLIEFEGRPWIVPVWFTTVEARRFRIGENNELRLYADESRPEGDVLRPGKWIVLQRPGRLARSGLMRTAVWPAIGKRLGWRDWLVFSQRFGIPLVLAKYIAEDADDDVLAVAEEIVKRIGSDGGAVVPKEITVELVEATKGQPNDKTHGGLIAHCNAEMAKLIVGSTLTNDNAGSGGASYALGEVHAAVRWDNVVFDAAKLQEAIRTQVCAPFMKFNNLVGSPPIMEIQVVRDLSPKVLVDIADTLVNKLGVKVPASQLRQVSGFRTPIAGDEAPGMPKATPVAEPVKEAA